MKILENCKLWLADGTFKISFTKFLQLYTIHGSVYGKSLPFVYSLITFKIIVCYDLLFNYLSKMCRFEPKNLLIDEERAVFNSIQRYFPNTTMQICLFHFSQSI
ncbi:hypothetical protein DMUE_3255 [Dictyocoela muelleri]|nr:hypothetical protein DMUE_3255 [Dictyocoela muelleri]